jgi:hypothetical protein
MSIKLWLIGFFGKVVLAIRVTMSRLAVLLLSELGSFMWN